MLKIFIEIIYASKDIIHPLYFLKYFWLSHIFNIFPISMDSNHNALYFSENNRIFIQRM
jgi:hypothetical protein